jgi:putative transposase
VVALENLALRQQLAVWKARQPRPQLRTTDRIFWIVLSRIWTSWRSSFAVGAARDRGPVAPPGLPPLLGMEDPTPTGSADSQYRAPRSGAADEPRQSAVGCTENPRGATQARPDGLAGDGIEVHASASEAAVASVARVSEEPRERSDRLGFLHGADRDLPMLFVLIVLSHGRRRLVHFNVTEHPTADWTARQLLEACGQAANARHLIRDRDQVYGDRFSRQAKMWDLNEAVIAPPSPWQNAYAERVIGSIRRECLDDVVVISERHLHRILSQYVGYDNAVRTHLSLGKDAPEPRTVQPRRLGTVGEVSRVGGLHHEYVRRAA